MFRRAYNLAVFIVFVAALMMPAALYAAGQRARALEGRPLTPPPAFSARGLLQPEFYAQLSDYLRDANPMRETLVKTAAEIRYHVTHDISGSQVLPGQGNWLFLTESVVRGCYDEDRIRTQVNNLSKFAGAMRDAGIPVLFSIAPDKPSIYPEKLTPLMVKAGSCWDRARHVISQALDNEGIAHWDGWTELSEARRNSDTLLYLEHDTHWSQWGSIRFSAWVVQTLAPELALAPPRQTGTKVQVPDLSRMAGFYGSIEAPVVIFDRPGAQAVSESQIEDGSFGRRSLRRTASSTPEAPLSGKRLLIVHDSFMYVSQDQISQYFADTVYMHWSAFTPESFVKMASAADAVVIEVVEREAYKRLQDYFGSDRVGDALRALPAEARATALAAWPRIGQ